MEKNKNYINSFLVENYPIKGARQCSVELGMNYNIIKNRASNLKLKKIDNILKILTPIHEIILFYK